MKAKTSIPSLGAMAFVTLLAAGPAQACMPFGPAGAGQSSCATPQSAPSSCPAPGQDGKAGQSCGLVNPELMSAVGEMAAGGMQIATHMMKMLATEVGRYAAAGDVSR